jgi:hypothetical protein
MSVNGLAPICQNEGDYLRLLQSSEERELEVPGGLQGSFWVPLFIRFVARVSEIGFHEAGEARYSGQRRTAPKLALA